MIERQPRLAWKVGLFVLVALGLLGVMIFAIRGYRTLTPGYTINVLFHSAGGISRGAPVKFAGVSVGEVQAVAISRTERSALPQVTVSIWLPRDLVIRSDDRAQIGILGLLGEKYLEIESGAGQGAIVQSGGQLIGEEPLSELGLMLQAHRTLQRLDHVLAETDALMAPTGLFTRLNATLDQLQKLSDQLEETAHQAQLLMRPWREVGEHTSALLAEPERYLGLLIAVAGLIFVLLVL
jgi:phospholipid/cholesterol/gamma-HCH transport system substrate-binding protein